MKINIAREYDGKTVRDYLKNVLKLSSNMLASLKADPCGITVNGVRVTVRYVLKCGDILGVAVEDSCASDNIVPRKLDFGIIFEDNDIIVVNKPPYMPTHPSHSHYEDSLANGLAYIFAERNIPFVFRAVNRLDRDTSGIVLVAKNAVSACQLNRELSAGHFEKSYLAVLEGTLEKDFGTIETYIRRAQKSVILRQVCEPSDDGAEYARTDFCVLARNNGMTAVIAQPKTGRTHQLRVHFAHIGHPISGDGLYGKSSDRIGRQALHALRLSFPYFRQDRRVDFEAPIPADMDSLMRNNSLFSQYTGDYNRTTDASYSPFTDNNDKV